MFDPEVPVPQSPANLDATLLSQSKVEVPTHSSLSPQQQTSTGETKPAGPLSTVIDVGSQLGPYRLEAKLGEGGMGAVYRARHTKLSKLVALKILPQHVLSRPDALARFEREMLAVGSLHHPNVVQAHDAGEIGGVHYLSMEYVEGQDLQELVKAKGPLSVANACKAIRQAALGLAAAHKLGLVHRDIKPSNLFVTKETGQIKILDMGLALLSQEQVPAALTSTGQCFGTPDYMAPEQWEDAHTCDGRADLYALGCTLFLLLTGRTPYGGDEYRSVPRKMKGHIYDPIPDLKAARAAVGWTPSSDHSSSGATGGSFEPPVPAKHTGERSPSPVAHNAKRTDGGVHPTSDIPDGLDAIYRKLMAKEPKDRFASADQLAEVLAPFTRQRSAVSQGSPVAPRQEARTSIDAARAANPQATDIFDHAPGFPLAERDGYVGPSESRTSRDLPQPLDSDITRSHPNAASAARHVARSETATLGDPSLQTNPPRCPGRKWLLALGGAAAMVLFGVIIITITNKDGTKTKIEVPGDSKIEITTDDGSRSRKTSDSFKAQPDRSLTTPATTGWHGWPADAPPPAIAPFDAERAKQHQRAWAEYLKLPVEYTNSLDMKFVLIPPGEFTMGSSPQEIEEALKVVGDDKQWQECVKSEGPQHKVILTQAIYLGIHEVTQKEYAAVMGTNPSHFSSTGAGKETVANLDTQNHPVEMVSWNDAAEFCAKLSQKDDLKPFYFRAGETVTPLEGSGYRLPTEAEWEFACRAGTTTKYWMGDNDDDLVRAGWFSRNAGVRTHAVGELKPNPFGLFDVHGNVYEWVHGWWEPSDYSQLVKMPRNDPDGVVVGAGAMRPFRGGHSHDGAVFCRATNRSANPPTHVYLTSGFRVSLPADAVKESLKRQGVTVGRAAPPSSEAPIDFAAERQAAEWVLSLGGGLELIDGSGVRNDPVDGKLPDTPFAVHDISISNGAKVQDDDLARLARCRRLAALNLSGFSGNGSGLSHLAAVHSLRRLMIADSGHISDSGLQAITSLPQLRFLDLGSCPNLTDQCLTHVGQLVALETLELGGTQVGDAGVKHLSQLSRLRRHIVGSRVTDAGIRQLLEQHPNLETLAISSVDGSERTLMPVAASRSLQHLRISGNLMTADGLRVLQALPTLRTLHVQTPMTTDVVLRMAEVRQLKEVELHFDHGNSPSPGDAAFAALARLPRLERIYVEGDVPSPGDSVLEAWAGIPNLKSVTLRHNEGKRRYTPAGIAKFREQRPDVQLNIDGKDYPAIVAENAIDFAAERQAAERLLRLGKGTGGLVNKDRQWIAELKAPLPVEPFCILVVGFAGADVTDEDLAVLAGCRAIAKLDLQGNRQVTAAGLRKLGPLPFLKELNISETNTGNDAINWLANAPMLMSLSAYATPINAEGWETLPPCSALRALDTSHQVGDAGLRRIVEQCPELRELWVDDPSILDLSPLTRLTRLNKLSAHSIGLSDAAIDTLLKLPVLDGLAIRSPDAAGLARLPRLAKKLTRFSFRQQNVEKIIDSEAWAPVTQMSKLLELEIMNDVAVDSSALRRIAAMPNLRRVRIGNDENPGRKAQLRNFTADDIAEFRKARPDIELSISGQSYPALSDWPGKFEGSTRIADWTELPPGGPAPAIGTFSPDIAQQRQEEWAKHLQQPVEIELDVAAFASTRAGRGSPDPAPGPTEGLPKDAKTTPKPDQKGDLRSNEAAGSGDPRRAQSNEAAGSGDPRRARPATTLKFRLIPPSEAVVNSGSPEQPRFVLQRVMPYYLGATEVTVGQFQQFVAATGYVTDAERSKNGFNLQFQPDPHATWKTPGYAISDDLPVTIISPADAQAFCDWLNESSPLVPREESRTKSDADAPIKPNDKPDVNAPRPSSRGTRGLLYRLPTEREWELASRAGGAGDYGFAGNAPGVLDYAWTTENVQGKPIPVQPVATKRANPFGLHDVLGNVWEWYTTEQGSARGVTGNGFENTSGESTFLRRAVGTHFVQPNTGFRVVRQLQPSSPAPKFAEHPVLVPRHAPLGPQATVTRPAPIPGLRSWTIELAGHQSYVSSIAWSPKGNVIATASSDMSVRLWDRDGHLKSILLGHAGGTTAGTPDTVSFSPDGTRLATVDMSTDLASPSTLRIWDVSGSPTDSRRSRETSDDPANPDLSQVRLLAVVPLRSWGWCVAWSPDGKQIAYGGTQWMCEILDVTTGQARSLNVEGDLASLAWSADSRTLCVPEKGLPTLFDAASGQKLATLTAPDAKPEEALASRVAWSPDGRWLSGAHGKQVRIWDAATRKHLRTIPIESDANSLAWHKDSQLLAIISGGAPYVLNTKSGEVAVQSPLNGGTQDIAWSPDGTELVFQGHGGLHFIDGKTGKLLRSGPERGQNHLDPHQPTFLSPDGRRFHAKQTDFTVERLEFDAETGVLLEHRKTPQGILLATASDERWRAYQKSDPEVVIEPKRFDRDPVTITTPGVSWIWRSDPSGERIAKAFGQQVLIWDATTGKPLGTLPHPAKLWSFEWSPDGKQLATAADDKTIRLWNTQTNKLTAEFKQFPQELGPSDIGWRGQPILAWTRDGRSLWIPLGTHAGLLDLSTGRVAPVENFSNGNVVGSLTLASDGDRLLVREEARTFLRDRDGSRQLLGQFLGIRPQWHPDSRRFLSGADHFGVRGFDVTTRQRLGTLWPVLTANHWLCIGPTGHYRGSPNVEDHIVYVTQLDDGTHITLTPTDFAKRFAWKNDPDQATLLKRE